MKYIIKHEMDLRPAGAIGWSSPRWRVQPEPPVPDDSVTAWCYTEEDARTVAIALSCHEAVCGMLREAELGQIREAK